MTDTEKKVGNPNWVKGVSGNPDGRPVKGNSFAEVIRSIGDEIVDGITNREAIARKIINIALNDKDKRQLEASKIVMDRVDGKAVEKVIELNTEPIKVFNRDEVDTR